MKSKIIPLVSHSNWIKTTFPILLSFCFLISCQAQEKMIDKSLVQSFELEKYLGTWYEIARYDHRFERGLEGVTATYSLREDGMIKVKNSGYKGGLDGKYSEAIGKAKVPDTSKPAHLKVSFFWIFYGDYYVMELDPDYQWAIVGSSSDKYLWILARDANISEEKYEELLQLISRRGYATDALIRVKHK